MLRFFCTPFLFSTAFCVGLIGYNHSERGLAEAEGIRATRALHDAEQIRDDEHLRSIVSERIRVRTFQYEESLTRNQFIERILNFGGEITQIEAKWMSANAENDVVVVSFWMKMSANFPDQSIPLIHAGFYRYEFCREPDALKLCGVWIQSYV